MQTKIRDSSPHRNEDLWVPLQLTTIERPNNKLNAQLVSHLELSFNNYIISNYYKENDPHNSAVMPNGPLSWAVSIERPFTDISVFNCKTGNVYMWIDICIVDITVNTSTGPIFGSTADFINTVELAVQNYSSNDPFNYQVDNNLRLNQIPAGISWTPMEMMERNGTNALTFRLEWQGQLV